MIPNNNDLVEAGLELLPHQFRNKLNVESLLSSFTSELDQINNDIFTLVDNFNVDDATGIYLDYIGKVVGEIRNGDNDDDFRKRIEIRILINNSEGTPNDILEILSELTETNKVKIWEHFPCSSIFYTNGNNGNSETLNALLKSAPATSEISLLVDTTNFGIQFTELVPNYKESKQQLFAEILEGFDTLIDDQGNFIVDDQGNNIVVNTSLGDSFSYYGRLNEVVG